MSREEGAGSRAGGGPACIYSCKTSYGAMMNNDCLFLVGGMFSCFCPNACVVYVWPEV